MKIKLSTFHFPLSTIIINLFVALAVSLIVNFSYVMLLIVDQQGESRQWGARQGQSGGDIIERSTQGILHIHPDGHGYIIYEEGDSVYASMQRIRRLGLSDGDKLVVDMAPRHGGAAPMMVNIKMRNGEEFDYGALFNRPSQTSELTLQLIHYLVVSFVLLTIMTSSRYRYSRARFIRHCLWCVAAAVLLYLLAPVRERQSIVPNIMTAGSLFDYMLLLKFTFATVVSMLYGWIYVLNSRRQAVVMENERLKVENLTTRYNMLVGQINPHFFFNSLNSLAMLVREKQDEKALTYIDQLSYTFRYIIQNGQSGLITLEEEFKFVEAYCYLFKIRYADKLFFDIEIEEKYNQWRLPALSVQPLLDNAVKHNTITRNKPLHISIRTESNWLVVSNPKVPKLEAEPSTGIGLENLRSRWSLITGQEIEIIDTEKEFIVRMPLQKPLHD